MKKVFKASVLAVGVAAAFGASAADIIVQPASELTLSQQGLSVGNTVSNKTIVFDTVISEQHAATSEIVLTLGENVDLTAIDGGACGAAVNGVFSCGGGGADVSFNVGTGNFTFDNVEVDPDAGTLTFAVSLGNAITPGSSFRTTIGDAANGYPVIKGAFGVQYNSSLNTAPIEEGFGEVATVVDQFSGAVVSEFDGVIERVNAVTFVRNGDDGAGGASNTEDSFSLKFTDIKAKTEADATVDSVVVTLKGNFDTNAADSFATATLQDGGAAIDFAAVALDKTRATLTIPGAVFNAAIDATNPKAGEFTEALLYTYPATGKIGASDFVVESVKLTYSGAGGVSPTPATLVSEADAGQWRLDAAVVNVPYLPVGAGLTPNVEIANDSAKGTESEIVIEAYDQFGNQYGPETLADTANGKTVTKVSESDIQEAFNLDKNKTYKLSVTFMIDADLDKVSVAPYYKQGESRINVLSDQYKSDDVK